MFYYSKFESSMIIKRNGGQNKCQRNDLTQFSGQNFTKIRIDGRTKYQQKLCSTEFLLKSCNSVIDKVEVYYCQINLDEAAGNFQHIVFKNCTFTGGLSDKFNAESLEFFCGIQLYSLSAGNVKEINVTCVNKNVEIDFANANEMKNLNKLIFKSVPLNLLKLTGTWKLVQMANCSLNELISNSLKAEYFYISSFDQNILSLFAQYQFGRVYFSLTNQNELSLAYLKNIQWQSISLILEYSKIDFQQLQGHFTLFKAVYCSSFNSLSSQFTCNQMVLIMLTRKLNNSHKFYYNTTILQNIKCDVLYIFSKAVVDYIPENIKELYLQTCRINLTNILPNLEIMKLQSCKYFKISASQVPSLKELLISAYYSDKSLVQFKNCIQKRGKLQFKKQSLQILIQTKIQELNTHFQHILQLRQQHHVTQLILYNLKLEYE
ncbi:Hypothetical_protein [Hexamita inflata]|uniref:Hypothetical_protein n=1 Tax=Hexamita inflata TaxID=28002 RepID=A0AA86NAV4_9EUKA|nr:Hypothetical protein HINF_LOCUS3658 [Hexamita inflata]